MVRTMELQRRLPSANSLSFGSLLPVLAAAPALGAEGSHRSTLDGAIDAFFAGWLGGDWSDFLSRCADDFIFQFPAGPHRGRHEGAAGRAAIAAWCMDHARASNRITETIETLRMYDADWAVICDRGSGTIDGAPYTGLHAIFLRAGGSGQIIEYREYFGELPF